jgi:hypothetical protein
MGIAVPLPFFTSVLNFNSNTLLSILILSIFTDVQSVTTVSILTILTNLEF